MARAGVEMKAMAKPAGVPVWDPFVRVFHWALVGCVFTNFFIVDDGETLHQWLGYGASALVLARVVWGFVGTTYARFSNFFPTPARLRAHLGQLKRGEPPHAAGHNPLGALMMLALMALVLCLGATGFLQTTDRFWGVEWLQDLHEGLGQALIGLAGLHALAALVMSRVERTRLVRAMVTGVKEPY
jgi:cytochrome b